VKVGSSLTLVFLLWSFVGVQELLFSGLLGVVFNANVITIDVVVIL